jgi:hypothetical protein
LEADPPQLADSYSTVEKREQWFEAIALFFYFIEAGGR